MQLLKRKRLYQEKKGFTFIEVILSIVILSICGVIFIDALTQAVDTFTLFDQRKETVYRFQFASSRMIKDFRYIKRNGILRALGSEVEFNDSFGRQLNYRLNGTDIEVKLNSISSEFFVLSSEIQNLTFVYYDKNNNQIPSPVPVSDLGDIQWIDIILEGTEESFDFSTNIQVYPREMYR